MNSNADRQELARKLAAAKLAAQEPPRQFTLPKPGQVITVDQTNYYIGPFLGRGAFAEVYECYDDWGNYLVAKIISPRDARSYDDVNHRNHR